MFGSCCGRIGQSLALILAGFRDPQYRKMMESSSGRTFDVETDMISYLHMANSLYGLTVSNVVVLVDLIVRARLEVLPLVCPSLLPISHFSWLIQVPNPIDMM